jgi:hypothetical protein
MARRVAQSSKALKRKFEQAESGDVASANDLKRAEGSDRETAEAVEREAADGVGARGLAR